VRSAIHAGGDLRLHETGMILKTKPKAPMHLAFAKLSVREAFRRKGIAFAEQL
jgi:hypothetical protein